MVSLQRHQTPHWSFISFSHPRGSGETRIILQTNSEKVKAGILNNPTGVFDAILLLATQHWLFTQPTPKFSSNTDKDCYFHHWHTLPRNVKLQVPYRTRRKNYLQVSTFAPDTALEHHATLCTVARDILTHQDGYQQLSPKCRVPGLSQFILEDLCGKATGNNYILATASIKMPTLISA